MMKGLNKNSQSADTLQKVVRENKIKNAVSPYPMQERKQDNLQSVPHILVVDLKVILWIREILGDLYTQSRKV